MPKKNRNEAVQLALITAPYQGLMHEIIPGGTLQLQYETKNGKLYCGDTLDWLASLESGSIDLIFADPPYNIGKATWDFFASHDEYVMWSKKWIELASKSLHPDGTLYVCGFSEILADIKVAASSYFEGCRWLVWHYKNKANLGKDWGRSHESIIHFRKSKNFSLNFDDVRIPYGAHTLKYPSHPQAQTSQYGNGKQRDEQWTPHPGGAKPKDVFDIPTTCNGMEEKTPHPTQKPEELLRKIILASSKESDIVADPFSGSGTTLVVSEQLGRKWVGCDSNQTYNSWAIERLNHVPQKSIDQWIELDRQTTLRRESIR